VIFRRRLKRMTACLLFFTIFTLPCAYSRASSNTIIVVVKSRSIGPYMEVAETFKRSMEAYDYNIKIVEFDLVGESMPQDLKNNINEAKPQLIFSLGTPATKASRQAFAETGLTVVYAMVLNPAASNIIPPGVSMDIPFELKLKELKRILPQAKRIGVIYSPEYSEVFNAVSQAARNTGLEVSGRQINGQKEFSEAMLDVFGEIDCFLMIADPSTYLPKTTEHLLLEALQRKIPVVGLSSAYTKAGALLAFDCDYTDLGRQAAELVIKIVSGKAGSPPEMTAPRKMKFSLNLKVAERLGINIPQEMISEAGEVFGR